MIWIIGNRGLLGQEFERLLRSAGLDCLGTGREVDLADPRALTAFHRDRIAGHGKPLDWVVNCAAYTAVDRAESEPELCQRINAEGPAVLADFARRHGCGILQLSSDYVFDGQGLPGADGRLRPYREDDPVNPVGVYGRSKAAGESAVRAGCGRHIILRTAWLYGSHGPNFVRSILSQMRQDGELRVVADQWGSPTWTLELAQAIRIIVSRPEPVWGTYQFCGAGITTWHAFAGEIQRLAQARGLVPSVRPILPLSTEESGRIARRPMWSVLDTARIRQVYGIEAAPWEASLARYLDLVGHVRTGPA